VADVGGSVEDKFRSIRREKEVIDRGKSYDIIKIQFDKIVVQFEGVNPPL